MSLQPGSCTQTESDRVHPLSLNPKPLTLNPKPEAQAERPQATAKARPALGFRLNNLGL